jgi:hypothetical protein
LQVISIERIYDGALNGEGLRRCGLVNKEKDQKSKSGSMEFHRQKYE